LSKILGVKAARPVNPAFPAANPDCVNPVSWESRAGSGLQETPPPLPIVDKSPTSQAAWIYAAVTLSLFMRI